MDEKQLPNADEMRFSEALGELEGIISALEEGELDLEDSLALYQRGVELLRSCKGKLADAEQKVEMLVGELETEGAQED